MPARNKFGPSIGLSMRFYSFLNPISHSSIYKQYKSQYFCSQPGFICLSIEARFISNQFFTNNLIKSNWYKYSQAPLRSGMRLLRFYRRSKKMIELFNQYVYREISHHSLVFLCLHLLLTKIIINIVIGRLVTIAITVEFKTVFFFKLLL